MSEAQTLSLVGKIVKLSNSLYNNSIFDTISIVDHSLDDQNSTMNLMEIENTKGQNLAHPLLHRWIMFPSLHKYHISQRLGVTCEHFKDILSSVSITLQNMPYFSVSLQDLRQLYLTLQNIEESLSCLSQTYLPYDISLESYFDNFESVLLTASKFIIVSGVSTPDYCNHIISRLRKRVLRTITANNTPTSSTKIQKFPNYSFSDFSLDSSKFSLAADIPDSLTFIPGTLKSIDTTNISSPSEITTDVITFNPHIYCQQFNTEGFKPKSLSLLKTRLASLCTIYHDSILSPHSVFESSSNIGIIYPDWDYTLEEYLAAIKQNQSSIRGKPLPKLIHSKKQQSEHSFPESESPSGSSSESKFPSEFKPKPKSKNEPADTSESEKDTGSYVSDDDTASKNSFFTKEEILNFWIPIAKACSFLAELPFSPICDFSAATIVFHQNKWKILPKTSISASFTQECSFVFLLGTLLWQLFTLSTPYKQAVVFNVPSIKTRSFLLPGKLPQPSKCPSHIITLIQHSWNIIGLYRPSLISMLHIARNGTYIDHHNSNPGGAPNSQNSSSLETPSYHNSESLGSTESIEHGPHTTMESNEFTHSSLESMEKSPLESDSPVLSNSPSDENQKESIQYSAASSAPIYPSVSTGSRVLPLSSQSSHHLLASISLRGLLGSSRSLRSIPLLPSTKTSAHIPSHFVQGVSKGTHTVQKSRLHAGHMPANLSTSPSLDHSQFINFTKSTTQTQESSSGSPFTSNESIQSVDDCSSPFCSLEMKTVKSVFHPSASLIRPESDNDLSSAELLKSNTHSNIHNSLLMNPFARKQVSGSDPQSQSQSQPQTTEEPNDSLFNISTVATSNDASELYQRGCELALNQPNLAFEFFHRASHIGGHIPATHNLGVLLTRGRGSVSVNPSLAVHYFTIAAERGYTRSQYNLGLCYLTGFGVGTKVPEKAFYWFKKSAASTHPDSLFLVGLCLERGVGCQKNPNKALNYYLQASINGHAGAQSNLGYCLEHGIGTAVDLPKAVSWYEKSANNGYVGAMARLGYCLMYGIGITRDINCGFEWFQKAAKHGHLPSQNFIGFCLISGKGGVPKNPKAGLNWLLTAGLQHHPKALFNLGTVFHKGIVGPSDMKKAYTYYTLAAKQGHSESMVNLGFMYKKGLKPLDTIDFAKAAYWYRKASLLGSLNAKYNLAILLWQSSKKRDCQNEAVKLFIQAAAQGHSNSLNALKHLKLRGVL